MSSISNIAAGTTPKLFSSRKPQTLLEEDNYKILIKTGLGEYYTDRDTLVRRAPNSSLAENYFPKNWINGKFPDKDGFYEKKLESVDREGFDQVYKWCLYGTIPDSLPDLTLEYTRRVADQFLIKPCLRFIDEVLPLSKAAALNQTPEDYFNYANKLAEVSDILFVEETTIDREFQKGMSIISWDYGTHRLEYFIRHKQIVNLNRKFLVLAIDVISDTQLFTEISAATESFTENKCGVVLREIKKLYTKNSGNRCSPQPIEPMCFGFHEIEYLASQINPLSSLSIEDLVYLRTILLYSQDATIADISERVCQQRGNGDDWITHARVQCVHLHHDNATSRPMLTALKQVKNVNDPAIRKMLLTFFNYISHLENSEFSSPEAKFARLAEIMHILRITFAEFNAQYSAADPILPHLRELKAHVIPQWRALIMEEQPEDAASQQACTTFEKELRTAIAASTPQQTTSSRGRLSQIFK